MDYYIFAQNLLTSAASPNDLTTISYGAFYKNQLTSVNIPNSVTSIASDAFISQSPSISTDQRTIQNPLKINGELLTSARGSITSTAGITGQVAEAITVNNPSATADFSQDFTYGANLTATFAGTLTINSTDDLVSPIISGADNLTLSYGDSFDSRLGVTAVDNTGGDLTGSIVISGDAVDTSKPGSYNLIYTVTDQAGHSTTVTRVVTVLDVTSTRTVTRAHDKASADDTLAATGMNSWIVAGSGLAVITAGLWIIRRART